MTDPMTQPHQVQRRLHAISGATLLIACGGKVMTDVDPSVQDAQAEADVVGCAALHDYDTCVWKSDASCGWGGPECRLSA
jgi:hypothetical protein